MKLRALLSSALSSQRPNRLLEWFLPLATKVKPDFRDLLRLAAGDAEFQKGNYEAALFNYHAVGAAPHLAEARKMVDWIDYKFGRVAAGWPDYPVAKFDPGRREIASSQEPGPVFVRNPNQPYEIVHELGLSPWRAGRDERRPVLVWFNFLSSLGGEILASKIVRAFKRQYDVPLVLAVDDRLRSVLAPNFPDCAVIGKSEDLSRFRNQCGGYILARDVLGHVVRSDSDFATVADERLIVAPANIPSLGSNKAKIAISWKTTNRSQGRYRNIPLKEFAKMLGRVDAEFHCAQHNTTNYERNLLTSYLGERMRFGTIPTAGSVDALAAGLAAMSGVVTIDNSVLHIAGAFDVATIALLSVPSYWAWPISGEESRWYPSVSLVHQLKPAVWDEPLLTAQQHLWEWTAKAK